MFLADELERAVLALQMLAPNDANYFARRHSIICALRDIAEHSDKGGRRWFRNDRPGRD